jgi:methylphosphotriester-DNA--protein-cysteine methyltransferase
VAKAHAVLLDPRTGTAEDFARALGVSERHAARLSLSMFGFPPKLLLLRQRFLRTLAALAAQPEVPWATLLDQWYYDESHFIRDFQRFMSTTPRRYFAGDRPMMRRAGAAREEALGATYQGLHGAKDA